MTATPSTMAPSVASPMPTRTVLSLDANECIGGPPLPGASSEVWYDVDPARYPSRAALETAIACRSGVDAERIVATAGADDAIDRLCRLVLRPGSVVVLAEPTFPMFRRFAEACGATVRTVDWREGRFPTRAFVECSEDADLVMIASPNNPTGLVAPRAALQTLRALCPQPTLLVDLAYAEYLDTEIRPEPSLAEAVRWMPRTVVLRTLSKAWGLAGLRIGWAEAEPETIRGLREAGGPFPMSAVSIEVARRVLDDERSDRVIAERVERTILNRDRTAALVGDLGLDPGTSRGNFLMIGGNDADPRIPWLRSGLESLDIRTRGFVGGAVKDRVRVTIPVGEEAARRLDRSIEAVLSPESILFDLDGVLADVSSSYRSSIRATAGSFDVPVVDADVDLIKAEGDANDDWSLTWKLIRRAGVEVDLEEVTEVFQRLYLGTSETPGLRGNERPFIDAACFARVTADRPVGIVTGRPRDEATWFLDRFGLRELVDVLVAREDAPLKPEPDGIELALDRLGCSTAWFLGDTVDDVRAARKVSGAMVVPIGVAVPGSSSAEALTDAGAAIVRAPGDRTADFIQEVIG